jgi:predicted short-subunit dehydrogenase-like oxidoreductase (DUF2520 family)
MTITLIGAGNLATRLGTALKDKGYKFLQVYSRTIESAGTLADKLDCEPVINPESISGGADLYICALKDDALEEVLSLVTPSSSAKEPEQDIKDSSQLVAGRPDKPLKFSAPLIHTSGSLPMSVLASFSDKYGVLYPLQTFSKDKEVDFKNIPVFIEASGQEVLEILQVISKDLSYKVVNLDSEKRKLLHISAVFACNFVNYMYTVAGDILDKSDLDFDYLIPLIDETSKKIHEMKPVSAQTGPAKRYDNKIIEQHINMLSYSPELAELYETISKRIFERHKQQ